MRYLSILIFLLAVASFGAADAHGHGNHVYSEDSVCGTPDFGPALTKRIMDIKMKKKNTFQSRILPSNVTIDTYFCIVTDSGGIGDVPDSVLQKQITVLNKNFAISGSRFRFQLKGALREVLQVSSTTNIPLDNYVNQLGPACRQGGLDALNFFIVPYIQSFGNGQVLGITYSFFQTGVSYADGIYMLSSNLPGGGFFPVDLGLTAVHEIGHWLGLIHTFQAIPPYDVNPCNPSNPNDYIADTPQMYSSSISIKGCPVNRDSCPLDPGLDPTNNFMDYGYQYDSKGNVCKTTFTPQQVARMDDVWELYRVQNDICATNEFQFELQLQFDQNPQNTAWDIKASNGTILHQSITDGLGISYDSNFAGQVITVYKCFPLGTSYIFDIYSSSGQGITAPGYYKIYINGKIIAQGGQDFKSSKAISFGATTTTTSAPTRKPSSPPTLQPISPPSTKCPTAKTTPINVPPGFCFSPANTVDVENVGTILISDLKIGDKVKTADGTFVNVYSFGHYQSNARVAYLQIHAKGITTPLEVSNDHLLFVGGNAVPASKVSVGDYLDSITGLVEVTMVKTVMRFGAYAPFTMSGTIMVNGVAASCYVTLQEGSNVLSLGRLKSPLSMHWLAHLFQAPHRLMCTLAPLYCKSENYTSDGISKWVADPLRLSQWFVRQNAIVMAALLVPALMLGLILYFTETCFLHREIFFAAMLGLVALVSVSRNCFIVRTKSKTV